MNLIFVTKAVPLALCSLALIGSATAQQQDPQSQQDQQQQDRQSGSQRNAPIAGKTTIGITVAEADLVTPGYRASKILRSDVYNDQNQKIGKIDDLVVSPDGKISVAVVNVSGFLGVNRHRVAIPVQQFTDLNPPKKVVLPGATKDALRDLPEFEYVKEKA